MASQDIVLIVDHDDPLLGGRRVIIQPDLFHTQERIMVPMTYGDLMDILMEMHGCESMTQTRKDSLCDLLNDYLQTLEGANS